MIISHIVTIRFSSISLNQRAKMYFGTLTEKKGGSMTFRQALGTINRQFKAVEEKLAAEGINLQQSARNFDEVAAALGCRFATAFRGLTARSGIKANDLVAIFGCGGVGLSAVMIAKAFDAKVIAIDVNDVALQNAKAAGADYLLKSDEAITEIQKFGGAHIAVDALGSQKTAELAVKSLRRMGKHIQLGLLLTEDGLTPMAMARVIGWELELIGSHGMAAVDYPQLLQMIADGKLDPSQFIKRTISLEDATSALANMASAVQDGITIIKP